MYNQRNIIIGTVCLCLTSLPNICLAQGKSDGEGAKEASALVMGNCQIKTEKGFSLYYHGEKILANLGSIALHLPSREPFPVYPADCAPHSKELTDGKREIRWRFNSGDFGFHLEGILLLEKNKLTMTLDYDFGKDFDGWIYCRPVLFPEHPEKILGVDYQAVDMDGTALKAKFPQEFPGQEVLIPYVRQYSSNVPISSIKMATPAGKIELKVDLTERTRVGWGGNRIIMTGAPERKTAVELDYNRGEVIPANFSNKVKLELTFVE